MNCFGQRLHHADSSKIPNGFRAFRKYDGHSAVWLPLTRNVEIGVSGLWTIGKTDKPVSVVAPDWWISFLPADMAIHGELWHESDHPEKVTSAMKKNPIDSDWEKISFVPFAFPANVVIDASDESQFALLENSDSWESLFSAVEENSVVRKPEEFFCDADQYISMCSAEGVVFQDPKSSYQNGRVFSALKWKPAYDDECIIVGYENKSHAGSLIVEYTHSEKSATVHGFESSFQNKKVSLKLNVSDSFAWKHKERVFPIGDSIKIAFLGFTSKGTPKSARIY